MGIVVSLNTFFYVRFKRESIFWSAPFAAVTSPVILFFSRMWPWHVSRIIYGFMATSKTYVKGCTYLTTRSTPGVDTPLPHDKPHVWAYGGGSIIMILFFKFQQRFCSADTSQTIVSKRAFYTLTLGLFYFRHTRFHHPTSRFSKDCARA